MTFGDLGPDSRMKDSSRFADVLPAVPAATFQSCILGIYLKFILLYLLENDLTVMSEKKVHFAGEDAPQVVGGTPEELAALASEPQKVEAETNSRFKPKHSLDSDEEDNAEEAQMEENDIEGQEEATIDFDQGIKITPFNMKDELEEGHFDKEGTYIFSKENEIKDEWMDNINWVKIHQVSDEDKSQKRGYESSDDDEAPETVDEISIYRHMVEMMKPRESVSKALRRLGGGKAGLTAGSASERLKAKKAKLKGEVVDPQKAKEEKENRENVLKLTELADKLLQSGNMEIYQDTFEKLNFLIKTAEEKELASKTVIPEDMDDDDALDMFADHLDHKDSEDKSAAQKSSTDAGSTSTEEASTSTSTTETPASSTTSTTPAPPVDLDCVRWEYKWKNEEDEEVHGPFSSEEMAEWTEDNYFPDGVFVRKVGNTGAFYSSRRIDFELYT